MSIPESQFEVWAKQGAIASASAIYHRIKNNLKADPSLNKGDFEVYLQGSYRNSQNIHAESDVDVVAMLCETIMPDYSYLGEHEELIIKGRALPATYGYFDFKRDVLAAIRRAFQYHTITEGGKSIKIPRTSNNMPADVVPCVVYRRYLPSQGLLVGSPRYVDGIWLFDTKRDVEVISFPKLHYNNGVNKHAETSEWYKPTVRIFKNARCWLEKHSYMPEDTATSHSIECLLFNVPSHQFGGSYQATFVNVVNWLIQADMTGFVCQNGIQHLFADGRWTIEKVRTFLGALTRMWEGWGQSAGLRVR